MIKIDLFPTPIALFKLEDLDNEEENFLLNVDTGDKNNNYLNNISSNDTYILDNPKIKNLKNKIQKCIDEYKNEIMQCEDELYITNSWVSFLETGKRHAMHHHSNSMLSGVYFVNVNKDMPNFTIQSSQTNLWPLSWKRKKWTYQNTLGEIILVEKNMLILFPSSVWHSVDINKSAETRVSLSFNTFLKGDIKHNTYVSDLNLK
tara:strand:- start:2865 stop:3476 length:612 start_codon:yes stop_codon:yes gene_type:complete